MLIITIIDGGRQPPGLLDIFGMKNILVEVSRTMEIHQRWSQGLLEKSGQPCRHDKIQGWTSALQRLSVATTCLHISETFSKLKLVQICKIVWISYVVVDVTNMNQASTEEKKCPDKEQDKCVTDRFPRHWSFCQSELLWQEVDCPLPVFQGGFFLFVRCDELYKVWIIAVAIFVWLASSPLVSGNSFVFCCRRSLHFWIQSSFTHKFFSDLLFVYFYEMSHSLTQTRRTASAFSSLSSQYQFSVFKTNNEQKIQNGLWPLKSRIAAFSGIPSNRVRSRWLASAPSRFFSEIVTEKQWQRHQQSAHCTASTSRGAARSCQVCGPASASALSTTKRNSLLL